MLTDTAPPLPPATVTVIVRAANEGVPVGAIARVVQVGFEDVSRTLRVALGCGKIGSMPKPDWPPAEPWDARSPTVPRSAHAEDVEFQCKKLFKLTKLEAAFMMVLLRHDYVEKEKLHAVVEEQRAKRATRPDKQETTDPKMVDVIICKLRRKLKGIDPEFVIVTSWGSGYYLEAPVKSKILQRLGGLYAVGPAVERGDLGSDPAGRAPAVHPESDAGPVSHGSA